MMVTITAESVRNLAELAGRSQGMSARQRRELEAEIWWAVSDHSTDYDGSEEIVASRGVAAALDMWWGTSWRWNYPSHPVEAYLSSIDAVLAVKSRLLPDSGGYELIEMDGGGGQAEVASHLITADTAVLALLSAVLCAYADVLDEPVRGELRSDRFPGEVVP